MEQFVEGSEVPALGQIENKILPFDDAADFGQYHKGQAKSVELFMPLLLLATLALLAEGWLGAPRLSQAGQEQIQSTETASTSDKYKGRLWSPVDRLSRQVKNIIGKSTHDTPVLSSESKNGGRAG